jgi:cell division protein FtsW
MYRQRLLGAPDYELFAAFAALVIFGLFLLTSASAPVGYDRFGDSYFFIKRQLAFGILPGVLLFFFFAKVDYHAALRLAIPIFIGANILLALVFIPGIGDSFDTGARSWVRIGQFSFQPAEIAKISLIIFLAAWIAKRSDLTDAMSGFLPIVITGSLPIVLTLLQPDIGTSIVLFSILFGVLFVGGARLAHLLGLAGVGVIGFTILIFVAPYRLARLTTFLHPELDPQGVGYQINQASLAIGSGGLFGLGLGRSRQKYQYLPEVHADSIFAVIAEEMGLVVTLAFLALLAFIAYRGLAIARRAEDASGRLLAAGIVIWFLSQSFFNIGAMVGILPLTGLPLPFVSHGGTALMTALAGAGMLLNVSKYTQ